MWHILLTTVHSSETYRDQTNVNHNESKSDGDCREVGESDSLLVKRRLRDDKEEKEGTHEFKEESVSCCNERVETVGPKVERRTTEFDIVIHFIATQATGGAPNKG